MENNITLYSMKIVNMHGIFKYFFNIHVVRNEADMQNNKAMYAKKITTCKTINVACNVVYTTCTYCEYCLPIKKYNILVILLSITFYYGQ